MQWDSGSGADMIRLRLNVRKYEWLAPHVVRGVTFAKQTLSRKMGRERKVRFG
jgi:hypothetical protein